MEWVKLGDIAEIAAGKAAPKADEFSDNGLPFIRAGHLDELMNDGVAPDIPRVATEVAHKRNYKVFNPGTILFAKSGMSIMKDRVVTLREPAYIVSHLAAIVVDEQKVNNDYLKYQIMFRRPSSLIQGDSYPSISIREISDWELYMPNLNQQSIIASAIAKCESLIVKRREQIDDLDALVDSMFQDLLDSPNLKEVVLSDVILDKPCRLDSENEEPISYFDISSVNNKTHDIISEKIICKVEDRPGRAKQLIQSNDILVSNVRPNLKNIAYFRFDSSFTPVASTGFTVLRADSSKINPLFLYSFVISDEFTNRLIMKSTGANYPAVSEKEVRRTRVPLPKLELQNRFADYVTSIEAQKESLRASLSELETLFDALMQAAFSGHLNQSY